MMGPFSVRRARRFARAIDPDPRVRETADTGGDDASPGSRDHETQRLVTLVEGLRATHQRADGSAPSAEFKARLRQQLVTVAAAQLPQPAAVAPPADEPAPDPAASARRRRTSRPPTRRPPLRNPRLTLLSGAMSALVALSGVTFVASHHALPGDTLYSLKRTTENVELALARGDEAKAHRHLGFAETRARELRDLVDQDRVLPAGTAHPAPTPIHLAADESHLVTSTLTDMDHDTEVGVRLLTTQAVLKVEDRPLADLAAWESEQFATLSAVATRLPHDAATRVRQSTALLGRIHDRIAALRSQLTCSCMDRGHGDDLGPLPCWPCDPPKPAQSQASGPPPRPGDASSPPDDNSVLTAEASSPPPQPPPIDTDPRQSPPQTTGAGDDGGLPPLEPANPTPSGSLLPPLLPDNPLPTLLPSAPATPLLPGLPDLLPGLLGG